MCSFRGGESGESAGYGDPVIFQGFQFIDSHYRKLEFLFLATLQVLSPSWDLLLVSLVSTASPGEAQTFPTPLGFLAQPGHVAEALKV